MGKKARINWLEMKQRFIADRSVTYKSIADEYGVTGRTVERHAEKEGWMDGRKTVEDQVTEKIAEKVAGDIDEVNERHTKTYKNLQMFALTNLNILYAHIKHEQEQARAQGRRLAPKDIYSSQMAKFLAETLRIAMDGERITLGLPTIVTKGEQDVNLKSEFADRELEELEKLYKAVDTPNETNTTTDKQS